MIVLVVVGMRGANNFLPDRTRDVQFVNIISKPVTEDILLIHRLIISENGERSVGPTFDVIIQSSVLNLSEIVFK